MLTKRQFFMRVRCALVLLAALWTATGAAQAQEPRTVLLLHSQHRGTAWVRHVTQGVETVLRDSAFPVELRVEYMDSLRHPSPSYLEELAAFYSLKYPDDLDLVITVDDTALIFALQYREKLFPGLPLVFCGVNYYDPAVTEDVENIAGVIESWNAERTMRVALRLHPEATRVVVVNDQTRGGMASKRRLQESIAEFEQKIEFEFIGQDLTVDDLKARLAELGDDTIVLLMTYCRDAAGQVLSDQEMLAHITSATDRPIYGLYRYYIGEGIVGGSVTSGVEQGRTAARLAVHIFRGAYPGLISVVNRTTDHFVFDYQQLRRFGIGLDQLPADSTVINQPMTFFEQHRNMIISFTATTAIIILLLVLFLTNHFARQVAESKLRTYQQQLEELVERRTLSLTNANRKLADEIARRREAEERLERTLLELRESNADLERFAHIASHDLREPLRTITGFTSLLKRRYGSELDQDAREFIDLMVDAAKRAEQLISDLLQYSRVGTRGKEFEETQCDDILDNVLANLHFVMETEEVEITREKLPTVMADPPQLGRVFQNLIENSIKFRHEDRPVRINIHVEEEDYVWHIVLSDNGIGIEKEQLEHVFELFRRAHGTAYPGTGMGLAISRRIIERHGGRIWVESQPGEGTAFHFTLPKVNEWNKRNSEE